MQTRLLALVLLGWGLTSGTLQAQLIPQPAAMRYGLNRSWFTQVTLDRESGRFAQWNLDGDLLLVQTSQGILQALDSETGGVRWSHRIGTPGAPSVPPAANARYVAAGMGTMLYLFDRVTGATVWEQKLPTPVMTGLVLSKDKVFVSLTNSWLASYMLEDPAKGESHVATKGFITFPPVMTREMVVWSNDSSLVQGATFSSSMPVLQFETEAAAAAQVGYYPNFLFVPLQNNQLYCLHAAPGRLLGQVYWRFHPGDVVEHQPIGIDNRLFVATRHKGMYCSEIDTNARRAEEARKAGVVPDPAAEVPTRAGGVVLWQARRAAKFLAMSKTKVYAQDYRGNLLILDLASGSEQAVLPTPDMRYAISNSRTDRIFLASPTGLVQCLHEHELAAPFVHLHADEKPEEVREIPRGDAAAPPADNAAAPPADNQ